MKNCKTCRWVGCRNYGKEICACNMYIMSIEEEKRIAETEFYKDLLMEQQEQI